MENIISIDLKSKGYGKYDAYISTEGSSGAHYPYCTASEIADYVADLVDALEEANSGHSYLETDINSKYLLIATDGYSIDTTEYPTHLAASQAMQQAFAELSPDEQDESFAEMSYCSDDSAMLYTNGDNVYLWNIRKISFNQPAVYYILHTKSVCDGLFVYKVVGTEQDAYDQLRALVMITATKTDRYDIESIKLDGKYKTGNIKYFDHFEKFCIVPASQIKELSDVYDENLLDADAIPEELDLDHDAALYAVFNIDN